MSNRSQFSIRSTTRLIATLSLACAVSTLALLTPHTLEAQATGRVSGTVTSDQGAPIAGAQVVVVGTSVGGMTDASGRYAIPAVAAGTRIVRAQRIGFTPQSQTITVTEGGTTTADFSLPMFATRLTSEVVVGYTTQIGRDVSDAVSAVSAAEIATQTVATVEEALRGRIPGVQINASGEPGRPAQVFIRGQNFLSTSTPLYVVDGMYLRQNPNLNPDDIESIAVLKDASAAAQYGSQAANGVIVITTRRGQAADDNRIDLRSYYGVQDIPKKIDMMDSRQWAAIQQQAYVNANLPVPAGVTNALSANPVNLVNTDWQDAVFRGGKIQDHNLSVAGGRTNARYLISGGVFDQDGAIIETNFRRYSMRVNSDITRGRFTFGENIALSRATRQGLSGFPLIDVVRMLPTIAVYDANNPSGYGYGSGANPTFGTNPVGMLESRPQTERSNQVIGSVFGEVALPFHLKYRLNLGINYENYGRSEFSSIAQIRQGSPNQFAQLTEIRNDFTSLLAENLLSFDNQSSSGMHRLNAVAGYTEQQDNADDIRAYRRGFTDENLTTIDAGGEADLTNGGARRQTVLQSMLLRANYALLDRYLITGSIRRDGSSRFGPNNRWGTFSAISAGWIVSDENFFTSVPYANYFKLRASTGKLGNQDIGDYRYTVPLDQNRLGYAFNGTVQPGATQLRLANPDIRWQENRQTNFGVDLGLLDDRFSVTADYYQSKSSGLLVTAPLPWSLGIGEDVSRNPVVNAGSMRNSGFELGLTHRAGAERAAMHGFRLTTTATLTTTRNKVLSLGNGGQPLFDDIGVARTAVGRPLGSFYLIQTDGIFQNAAEVTGHTTTVNNVVRVVQPNAQPGDVRYIDANRDGTINDDDRVEIGSGTPKYSGGLFFDGGYSVFDFQLNMRGAGGFKIFNAARYWTDRMDDPSNFRAGFQPWTAANPSRTTPRALAVGNDNTRLRSDRWIEDGDYWRIQNLVVGYTLPASFSSRLGAASDTRSRIFLNIQNLHTFTGFSNWDPETLGYGNPLGRGIDDGRIYPNVRTFSFGVELKL